MRASQRICRQICFMTSGLHGDDRDEMESSRIDICPAIHLPGFTPECGCARSAWAPEGAPTCFGAEAGSVGGSDPPTSRCPIDIYLPSGDRLSVDSGVNEKALGLVLRIPGRLVIWLAPGTKVSLASNW